MSISTYADLKSAIADWLNRVGQAELEDRAPDFIRLFESQFDKQDVRHPKSLVRAIATQTAEYLALPANFVEMQRIRATAGSTSWATLRYVTPEELEDEKIINLNPSRPSLYSVVGEEIQIRPYVTSSTVTIEMLYWTKLTPLAEGQQVNWLLLESPEAYLYGALCEATPFIKEDERLPVWEQKRGLAIAALREASQRATMTSGTMKPRRRKLG